MASMQRKKIDNRIRVLIENGVQEKFRSFFVIVGDRGKDQVVILHHMLSKSVVRARPSVLWCYKKELGFSSGRKKKMRKLQKKNQERRAEHQRPLRAFRRRHQYPLLLLQRDA